MRPGRSFATPGAAALLLAAALAAQYGIQRTASPARAVELLQQWRLRFSWMDPRLPVMDGLEATRRTRALAGGNMVKIAALTAAAFAEQHDQMLVVGTADVPHKPFREPQPPILTERELEPRVARGDAAAAPPPPADVWREALANLPKPLRRQLTQALDLPAAVGLVSLVSQFHGRDAALGEWLRRSVDNLDFEELERAPRKRAAAMETFP